MDEAPKSAFDTVVLSTFAAEGKFNAEDVADLRTELLQSGLDSWQAAELISSFLSARGYGISTDGARSVVTGMDTTHSSLESMHQQLEQLALVM
jgi:hypothetical protein